MYGMCENGVGWFDGENNGDANAYKEPLLTILINSAYLYVCVCVCMSVHV